MSETIKKFAETLTGIGRPRAAEIVLRRRKPHAFHFADDGQTPNNPRFPLLIYRSPVKLDPAFDPAAIFEELFAAHGWKASWRNGIYGFLHFHTHSHEVLGIARGKAKVQFGGRKGRTIELASGDVAILPAGTGHKRLSASKDILVVGAYPGSKGGGAYDEPKPSEISHAKAVDSIAKVGAPMGDPVFGKQGPLHKLWR